MGIVRTFDIDRPFVARQAFEFAGRTYAPGDSFRALLNPQGLAMGRDGRTLWRGMRVANGEPISRPAPKAPPPVGKPAPDPKPGKRPRAGA